ncbi:MAG: Spx/MgsR family RNA polymerase-binding regulatory protein [Oscillospiraceae bacterium]
MNYIFYGYPKCSTCNKAKKHLTDKCIDFINKDISKEVPKEGEIKDMINISGLDINKFFNVSGKVYKDLMLKEKLKTMEYDEKIRLLSSNGMLIKRPIIYNNERLILGYKQDGYDNL